VPHVPARAPAASPLLVVVRTVTDLDGVLQDARGRAVAEDRPLLVALVAPPPPLTIDPVVHALYARLRAGLRAAVTAAAGRSRDASSLPDVGVVEVRTPRALTPARARRALDRRLDALARRHHAERHPDVPPAGAGR
jgi:hypothetical protein